MEKQTRKKEILKEIEELKELLNENQKAFFNDYMKSCGLERNEEADSFQLISTLTSVNYLDDAMCEYADSHVSVYYYDQIEYYKEHVTECMRSFKEYCYELKDFDDLEDAVAKAGACGWYDEIYYTLTDGDKLEELNDLIQELEELEDEK